MANVIDGPREFADPEDKETQIREYIKLSHTIDSLDARKKELREALFEILETQGEEDEKGNLLLPLKEPIDGVVRIEKSGRRSRKIDEDKATEIIEARGIGDDVYKMVRVIDEDALMAAYYEDKLTEQELDDMFPTSVVWALRIPKK